MTAHSNRFLVQGFNWYPEAVPYHLQSADGLVQGLKEGDVEAFRALSNIAQDIALDKHDCCVLMHLLVPHVLREDAGLQPGPCQQQQRHTAEDGSTTAGAASSDSNEWWCAAVSALAAVWGDHCINMGPDKVLQVLHQVLQGVLQLHQQQQQQGVDGGSHHTDLQSLSELWSDAGSLLMGVQPHSALATAVLQHSSIMPLLVAAMGSDSGNAMTGVVVQLVGASTLLLRELPVVHAAVCELLSSGASAGHDLLHVITNSEDQTALGLWQDPALQAACLEGARRAAAAVAAAVGSRGRLSAIGRGDRMDEQKHMVGGTCQQVQTQLVLMQQQCLA
jgi:hypothetical protein